MDGVFQKMARWAGGSPTAATAARADPRPILSTLRKRVRAGHVVVRLVRDDGEVFARGDRVSLGRTRTNPLEWHGTRTASGPYEVMGCSTIPSGPGYLLQLVLRVIDPA